jgi:uncharacterized protein YjfI (DUF2170 family)
MRKRNCRKTAEEIRQHETAVKIRKMTDKQICCFLSELQHSGNKISKENRQTIINNFISSIEPGNGIGQATLAKLKNYARLNILKQEESKMKFYEFNNCDYYALIGAVSEAEALNDYKEEIMGLDDLDDTGYKPDKITEAEAKQKLLNICKPNEREEAIMEFEKSKREKTPYLVLVDAELI